MDIINIEHTEITPKVILNAETGELLLEGKTLPENVNSFYKSILEWFTKYVENPNKETVLEVKLEYINTASSKAIFTIFSKLEKIIEQGGEVLIKWYYADDDEDMKDIGEEYAEVIKIPFEYIEYESED